MSKGTKAFLICVAVYMILYVWVELVETFIWEVLL